MISRDHMPTSASQRLLRPWTARRVALHGERLRVIVVDDNVDGADALVTYPSLQDIECWAVYSGKEALSMENSRPPHLILMDVSMPECTGLQVARALRQSAATAAIIIIAHTALDEPYVQRHSTDDEFDGYFQKGWDPKQLLMLLAEFAA